MRFAIICVAILIIAAINFAIAKDNTVPDGTIYGHVYDAQTKQPISQAWVYCQQAKCPKQLTDNSGYYAIESCFSPSSSYTIECTKNGYSTIANSANTDSDGKAKVDFSISSKSTELSDISKSSSSLLNETLVEWSRTFGGSRGDMGESVKQTNDDGYIITGYTASQGVGKVDAWLIKTDANGNEQWDKTFGGPGNDSVESGQQTSDGGYIAAGMTDSFGAGGEDIYLIKTNADGSKIWDRTFGGAARDWGQSVQQTSDGGYIIVGSTDSFGAGEGDVYLIKTDSDGKELWHKTFGGSLGDWGECVQQTRDSGYIITGTTKSYGAGNGDLWLIKTDNNGNEAWNRTIGGRGTDDGFSVQQTGDDGYIMTGWTGSYGIDIISKSAIFLNDFWLIKTDFNGKELWNNTFAGPGGDLSYSVLQSKDGGYLIAGSTTQSGSEKYDDVWLVKTDDKGNKIWDKAVSRPYRDRGLSAQQTSDGGYIIVGWTEPCEDCPSDVLLIKISSDSGKYDELKSLNEPPHLIKFDPINYNSPQESRTYPDFYADAFDPDEDSISYMYLVDGKPMTQWFKKSDWQWATSDRDVGRHSIEVRIRDCKHADENSYDDKGSIEFEIYKGSDLYLPEDASECDQKGLELFYKAKYDDAILAFDKAIELNPNLAQAWQHKGWALEYKGDYSEELKCYDQALRLDPTMVEAWSNRGLALSKLQRFNEAMQAFDKALQLNPKYMPAWYIKANCLKDQGRYQDAIDVFNEIIKIDTGEYGIYKDLSMEEKGDMLKEIGKYEESLQVFENIIQQDPTRSIIWADKGDSLYHLGRYDEAIGAYDKAAQLDPDYGLAWYRKAEALKALGRDADAVEAFSRAHELGY